MFSTQHASQETFTKQHQIEIWSIMPMILLFSIQNVMTNKLQYYYHKFYLELWKLTPVKLQLYMYSGALKSKSTCEGRHTWPDTGQIDWLWGQFSRLGLRICRKLFSYKRSSVQKKNATHLWKWSNLLLKMSMQSLVVSNTLALPRQTSTRHIQFSSTLLSWITFCHLCPSGGSGTLAPLQERKHQ